MSKTLSIADDIRVPHDLTTDIQLSKSLFGYSAGFFVRSGLARITRAVFLPVGYPASVSDSYIGFVKFSLAQVSLIAFTRVLSTQAMLLAVGIGQAGALPIAAVVNWVLKDGLGHLGSIIVGTRINTKFDSDPKRYKFMSVYLGQGANLLGILSLCHPPMFLLLTTFGSALSRIATLSFTSSRARIYENFARAGNLGDLIRCSQAQSTLATLLGTMAAVSIAPIIGANVGSILAVFFPASVITHYFAYKAVALIELTTLNRVRAELVIKSFLESGRVPTYSEVAGGENFIAKQPILFPQVSINPPISLQLGELDRLTEQLESGNFAILVDKTTNSTNLFFRDIASPEQAVKGFLFACSGSIEESYWNDFKNQLDQTGWKLDVAFIDQVDQRLVLDKL